MRRSRSMSSTDVFGVSRERSRQIRRNQLGASFPSVHRCRGWRRSRAVFFRRGAIFPPLPTGPSLLGSALMSFLARTTAPPPRKPAASNQSMSSPQSPGAALSARCLLIKPSAFLCWVPSPAKPDAGSLRLHMHVAGFSRLPARPAWSTTPRATGRRSPWPPTAPCPRSRSGP